MEVMSSQHIDGYTAPGFERVRDAFTHNLESGADVGAGFSAYYRGEKVVDLWGGVADEASGRPWNEDTMVIVFSTTKGATAICANQLAQRGDIDVNAPVADYWPEFAQAGKADVPVDYLLSHRVGLPYVDAELTLQQVLAWDPICEALAAQQPIWAPGSQHGYHAVTYGYLVGEVVRRVTGRSLGTYFRDEVAKPLGLEFYIGLPESEEGRVATLIGSIGDTGVVPTDVAGNLDETARDAMLQLMGPDSLLGKALSINGAFNRPGPITFAGNNVFNSREVHAAEVPAAAGICDARSLARMYAACIGEVDGVRLLSDAQLRDATTQRTEGPNTVLLGMDIQFGLGFMLPSSLLTLPASSFGHAGAGGSFGLADPNAGFGFGYVMNRMELASIAGDTRSTSLMQACYDSVA
jgi:CubicO group peptidase (beta-lactamase class C family)